MLIKRTTENEIVIKPADKGSIITVMLPEFYLNMCESHLRNEEYYECIQDNNPSPLLKKTTSHFFQIKPISNLLDIMVLTRVIQTHKNMENIYFACVYFHDFQIFILIQDSFYILSDNLICVS